MNYKFNEKTIRIPDKIIEQSITKLGMTKEEAIQMYLEDEGYLENEEQEELEKKAKDSRITATIHQAKSITVKKKTQKERVQKEDATKEKLVEELAKTIQAVCGNATITNKTRLIAFDFNGEKFELMLTRKNKNKSLKKEAGS